MEKRRKRWWQAAALLGVALLILAVRAWAFKDRVLDYEEGQKYLALCQQSGIEKKLWIYRLRELWWIAGGMAFSATVAWYMSGALCASLLVCLLGICPNEWWAPVLAVALTIVFFAVQRIDKLGKIPALLKIVLVGAVNVTAIIMLLTSTMTVLKKNKEDWAKIEETLSLIKSVDEGLILYNQPRYEDFFCYYLRDTSISWYKDIELEDIEKEYAYMLCEDGLWFADREVKEYGITYTDMGELWFPGLDDSLHLVQVQWGKYSAKVRSEKSVQAIVSQGSDGAVISMYPMDNFEEEHFKTFINRKVVNFDTVMSTGRQLVGALEYALETTNSLKTVYIGFDQNQMGAEENWNALLTVFQCYPEVHFLVLFDSPGIEEIKLPDDYNKWEKVFVDAVTRLDELTNVEMAYIGDVEWIFLNKGSRTEEGRYDDRLAKNILANALILKAYPINKANLKEHMDRQEKLVSKVNSGAYDYQYGADKTVVFMGDSVFGYTQGDASIPGVVENLLGAKTYNLGYGGMSATSNAEQMRGVWQLWQGALTGDIESNNLAENNYVCAQIKELIEEHALTDARQGENLIFVLNFGLNDYFKGEPLGNPEEEYAGTYLGAMRKVICSIREKYAEAYILVLSPNYVVEMEYGTRKTGEGNTLQDYREGIAALSEELDVLYLDINEVLGLKKENLEQYLADGTHPNFYGNFCYGVAIAEKLDAALGEE